MTPTSSGKRVNNTRPYFWHNEFHKRIANERMIFLLGSFDPVYRGRKTIDEIESVFTELKIRSFAIWELLGIDDLMLQVWLPHTIELRQLHQAIARKCQDDFRDTFLGVESFVTHWMWPKTVDPSKSSGIIDPADYVRLNSDISPSVKRQNIKRYEENNYIRRPSLTTTYKFFLRITNPPPNSALSAQELDIIAESCAESMEACGIRDPSVMRVSGEGGCFLISGRVEKSQLHKLSKLADMINDSERLSLRKMRTITHVSAHGAPIIRREQLLGNLVDDVKSVPTSEHVFSWLSQAESEELEFKSSAFKDVDFRSGKKRDQERAENSQVQEIAKAICGFLNTSGGTLIIGVAERSEFNEEQCKKYCGKFNEHGDVVVLGIEPEYQKLKKHWDEYERSLRGKVRGLVNGAEPWIKLHHVFLPDYNCHVCVIKVQRSPRWHYVRAQPGQRFAARIGGETRFLEGLEMDEHRQRYPRISG
jgi:hypothetical protein